jgi:hypothetical protein
VATYSATYPTQQQADSGSATRTPLTGSSPAELLLSRKAGKEPAYGVAGGYLPQQWPVVRLRARAHELGRAGVATQVHLRENEQLHPSLLARAGRA